MVSGVDWKGEGGLVGVAGWVAYLVEIDGRGEVGRGGVAVGCWGVGQLLLMVHFRIVIAVVSIHIVRHLSHKIAE